ncbi:MAG: hypothetical protein R3F61_04540 [Myxococcota bacterium]
MKPRKGAFILLIPVIMVIFVFVAYTAMFGLGLYGRPADGRRVDLAWKACPEAKAVVKHRVEGMGLGDPVYTDLDGGFRVTVTLPSDPEVAADIPRTLATPGVLRAHPVNDPGRTVLTNEHVTSAAIRQDLTLIPWTVLTLNTAGLAALDAFVQEDREGRLVYTIDGLPVGSVSNLKGTTPEVELTPEGRDDRDRMHKAAARSIVLDSGPVPCPMDRIAE